MGLLDKFGLNILNGFNGPIDTNNDICLGQMDPYTLIKATLLNILNGLDGPIDTNNDICLGQMDPYTLINAIVFQLYLFFFH